ncbi:MAG: 5-formyltetrahydrofolate cyclo-ligase [Gammaproteobacteria bacterium]
MRALASIRKTMRARRRALSAEQRLQAANRIADLLATHPLFLRSNRIAMYIPVAGEADPLLLAERAWALGKSVYLPVLPPLSTGRLWFLPFSRKTPLVLNRFAMPEPDIHPRKRVPTLALDLVLTPLVAFNNKGTRVGMGGGYYDNSFAFLLRRQVWHKPFLLGVAYQFQQVDRLVAQPWDVPLAGVVTDAELRLWR